MMKPNKEFLCSASKLITYEIEKYIKKENNQLVAELQKAGYLDVRYTLAQADKLETQLTNILQDKTDAFIKLLRKNKGESLESILSKLDSFNRANDIASAVNTAVRESLSIAVPNIANTYIKSIDNELNLISMSKRTSNWIRRWSYELADIMEINTQAQLEAALINGVENGHSIVKIIDDLVSNSALDNRTRARTTAITEILTANRVSANEAYIQSPAVEKKRWRHSGGRHITARDNHVRMDGVTVPKNSKYILVGADGITYYPEYPGDTILPPGERINCHCISQPIVNDDIIGMPLEEREALQRKYVEEYDKLFDKSRA